MAPRHYLVVAHARGGAVTTSTLTLVYLPSSAVQAEQFLLTTDRKVLYTPVGYQKVIRMAKEKTDVLHGSLALMVLRTLDTLGAQHGWGIARRIEQISGDALELNQGTLYPALLRLEQMGWITSKWGASDNNRRAKFYTITRAGKKQLAAEAENWERISGILARFARQAGESS
jgi:PadR family transcriptional regulator, regulatory protein PadR